MSQIKHNLILLLTITARIGMMQKIHLMAAFHAQSMIADDPQRRVPWRESAGKS